MKTKEEMVAYLVINELGEAGEKGILSTPSMIEHVILCKCILFKCDYKEVEILVKELLKG